ncbi:MAG: hypothetical protein K2P51_06320 [Rhabdochlamydiaceae bacterium]|nr:hypothetical protein [Rhabdochlamydiaceae bacterium]
MKSLFCVTLFALSALQADPITISHPEKGADKPAPSHPQKETFSSYMLIDPQARASDYLTAFEQLRKEKSTGKVYFQLVNGSMISNIIDMNLMPNSTMILFRFNTNQGIKLQTVKVEEIASLSYQ